MLTDEDASTAGTATEPPRSFVADGELTLVAPGRYRGSIPEGWKVIYAFGGVSMSYAVRAIQEHVGRDDLDLLSAHAVFCSPVPCADVEVDAETLRDGKGASQGRSVLRIAGSDEVGIAASATFGRLEDSPISYVDHELPAAAGRPDDHDPPPPRPDDAAFPAMRYWEQTDWRPALGTKWWDDADLWEPGPAVAGSWSRLQVEPIRADGSFDPLALCLPGDSMGQAIGQRLGPPPDDDTDFFTVTLELGLEWFARQRTPWVFSHIKAPVAGDGYGWSTVELFGEDGVLLAIARQRARLRVFRRGDGFLS